MTRAVAIVPLLLTAQASAQEFSCWPFKPNPPAGCRGEAHCACDSQRAIMAELPRLCAAAAVTLCALFCAGSASADPKGLWRAQDGAHVKVGPCGGAMCATIAALDPRSIRRPAGLGQTRTIRTRRSAAARLSASLFFMVWCRMERGDGPGDCTTSTTATAMPDISSSLAPPRSASKVARSASAAART